MPSKNALKEYEAGAYYHLYNRGVAKTNIFKSPQDYKTFLSYLKLYLSPPLRGLSSQVDLSPKLPPSKQLKNYANQVTLVAYCLMPNHFHLLVHQSNIDSINYFMRSLATKYVRYFNSQHHRVGHLFQDRYKAVKIKNMNQFLYLTKYIHLNPLSLSPYEDSPRRLSEYPYSSYPNYLQKISQDWLETTNILTYFSKNNRHLSYKSFVESEPSNNSDIADLTLDIEE